uniref:DUF3299 domain-containing protein n=1 Tax=Schlesneria paludicola TaxID=360056 RepID=A0A7C2K0D5_9PLAN
MPCHSRIGWLLVGCVVALGCDAGRPAGEFKTYDQLLTKEQAAAGTAADRDVDEDQPLTADIVPEPERTVVDDPPVSAIVPINVVDGTQAASILEASTSNSQAVTSAVAAAATAPRTIELLVPQREFKLEGKPAGLRVSYDDLDLLKILNMDPVPADATDHFPGWLKDLNGKQVRIRGFMYPTFESSGIEQFVLARDNQICCFGRDPKVYDLIAVQLAPGRTTDYIPNRPFDVVGTFRIEMLAERGKPLGLYWLEDAQVIDR